MPRNRKDIFRYGLFAHALGFRRSRGPVHRRRPPASRTAGDFMVTFGLWDGQTGTEFVQGATLMHELGHTFGLRHGGIVPGNFVEPNCKPNYQSVMNYLFQARGLMTRKRCRGPRLLAAAAAVLSEGALAEAAGFGASADYLARWYAPQSASFIDRALGTSPQRGVAMARRWLPAITDVRVDAAPRNDAAIDWSADGQIAGVASQDANFDGIRPPPRPVLNLFSAPTTSPRST